MAKPFTRSTSTFVMAVLKRYPQEGLSRAQLETELLRYAQGSDMELDGVRYRPNGVRAAGASSWFVEHVDRQLEVLRSLGLVIQRDDHWLLKPQEPRLTPDAGPISVPRIEAETGLPPMVAGKGLAQVLAHPSLFCLPEADFQGLVDRAFEELP